MIEEVDALPRETQAVAYEQAREWLARSDSPDIKPRLRAVAKKIDGARRKAKTADVREVVFNKPYDLEEEVLKFERGRINEALAKVNGKVHTQPSCLDSTIRNSLTSSRPSTRTC